MLTLGEWPLMPTAAAPSDYSSGTVGNLGVDSDRTHESTGGAYSDPERYV